MRVDAAEIRDTALAAHSAACKVDDRLLEAEALLQLGYTRSPTMRPDQTLASLQHAREVFRTHGLHRKVGLCQVAIARALYDLGEERNAIGAATGALVEATLPAEDRAAAYIVMALCHGHLGELDVALRLLNEHAVPISRTAPAGLVQAQAKWALGLTYFHVLLAYRAPGLARWPPTAPALAEPVPALEKILGLFDEARVAFPADLPSWGYVDMSRLTAQGLCGAADAADGLAAVAAEHIERDPPLACWALSCQVTLLLHRSEARGALAVLSKALELAQRLHLMTLLRDLSQQQSRACEAVGDMAGALVAYKRFAGLQLRSVVPAPSVPPSMTGPPSHSPRAAVEAGAPGAQPHELRNLEPVHVRRALRFIDARLLDGIDVGQVVSHCGVSRRTLETAFRQSRSTTIAQHIKQLKLEHASRALFYTGLSIREIAMSIGYRSPAAFAREFFGRFGSRPSDWRRNQPDPTT